MSSPTRGTEAQPASMEPAPIIVQQGKILDYIDALTQRKETPEEYVRQEIAKTLVREYDYEKQEISVEFTLRLGSRHEAEIGVRFAGRSKLIHLIGAGEVVPRLGRVVADRRHVIQTGDGITDRNQPAALTMHALFSHVPQTTPFRRGNKQASLWPPLRGVFSEPSRRDKYRR